MFDKRKKAVKLYESNVWGEIIHPGELLLTERMADVTGIGRGSRVLDVGSGKGESALSLSRNRESYVVGLDLSSKMVRNAKKKVIWEEVQNGLVFLVGEAENLPFSDDSFDVVLCECSFSIFADKRKAAREFWRVLRRGGKVGIADFYMPGESENVEIRRTFFPCVDGAEKEEEYSRILSDAGFRDFYLEDHTKELRELFLQLIFDFGSLENLLCKLPLKNSWEGSIDEGLREIKRAFRERVLGYCVMKGLKL